MKPRPALNVILALIASVLLLAPFTSLAAPPAGNWTLTWSDEFSGTSIDSTKWSWGALPWGGQHHNDEYASWITSEDSYLSGGSLWLRSRKATGSEFGGYPYSQGFVHSNGKMNYTYGYAEIRGRFPTGKGVWPAFWSLSNGWPPEFDIAEYFGSDGRTHMGLAYGTCCPASWNSSNFYEEVANWHTYGLEWGPGYARWYKDGALKKTIIQPYVPGSAMYLILNSGTRWDADASTTFPNYFQVDYVRLYKSAGPIANGTYRMIARHSGKALDAGGTGNGSILQQWSYWGGNNQKFTATHLGDSVYRLTGLQSGRAVAVNGASTANGAQFILWDYFGGPEQKFTVVPSSSGYNFIIPTHSKKVMDVNGASTANGATVIQWSHTGANNQQWSFQAP